MNAAEGFDDLVFVGPVTQEELILTWRKRRQQRLEREKEEASLDNIPRAEHHDESLRVPEAHPEPDENNKDSSAVEEAVESLPQIRELKPVSPVPPFVESAVIPERESLMTPQPQISEPALISDLQCLTATSAETVVIERSPRVSESNADTFGNEATASLVGEPAESSSQIQELNPVSSDSPVVESAVIPEQESVTAPKELISEPAHVPGVQPVPSDDSTVKPPQKQFSNVLRPARLNIDSASFSTDWTKRINMKTLDKPKRPHYVQPLE